MSDNENVSATAVETTNSYIGDCPINALHDVGAMLIAIMGVMNSESWNDDGMDDQIYRIARMSHERVQVIADVLDRRAMNSRA